MLQLAYQDHLRMPLYCTKLLLHPLLLWHCSWPRQRLLSVQGRSGASSDLWLYFLGYSSNPNQGRDHHCTRELAQICSSSPSDPGPNLIWVMPAIEPGRNNHTYLAQAQASLTPALHSTKMAADNAPEEKMWPVLTSNSALPPNPLDTPRLHRDASTQGYTIKTIR